MSITKLGPKAQRLREMRERNYEMANNPKKFAKEVDKRKALATIVYETGLPPAQASKAYFNVPVRASAKTQRETAMAKKSKTAKSKTKKPAKARQSKTKAPAAPASASSDESSGPRAGSKMEKIQALLTRPEGCTAKEILDATSWPTVSVPQQAKALGLALRKEKRGRVTQYFGEPIAA